MRSILKLAYLNTFVAWGCSLQASDIPLHTLAMQETAGLSDIELQMNRTNDNVLSDGDENDGVDALQMPSSIPLKKFSTKYYSIKNAFEKEPSNSMRQWLTLGDSDGHTLLEDVIAQLQDIAPYSELCNLIQRITFLEQQMIDSEHVNIGIPPDVLVLKQALDPDSAYYNPTLAKTLLSYGVDLDREEELATINGKTLWVYAKQNDEFKDALQAHDSILQFYNQNVLTYRIWEKDPKTSNCDWYHLFCGVSIFSFIQYYGSILHKLALEIENKNAYNVLFDILDNMFGDQRVEALTLKNDRGDTICHHAISQLPSDKCVAFLKRLLQNTTPEEQAHVLAIQNKWGCTVLHQIILHSNTGGWKKIPLREMNDLIESIPGTLQGKVLMKETVQHQTLLHILADHTDQPGVLRSFKTWFALLSPEQQTEVLTRKNIRDRNIFFSLALSHNSPCSETKGITDCLNALLDKLNSAQQFEVLSQVDHHDNTLYHYLSKQILDPLFRKIFNILWERLSTNQRFEILKLVNDEGDSILMNLVHIRFKTEGSATKLFEFIQNNLLQGFSQEQIDALLLQTNSHNKTIFDYCKNKSQEGVNILAQKIMSLLSPSNQITG